MKKKNRNRRRRQSQSHAGSFGFETLEHRKLMAGVVGSEAAVLQETQPEVAMVDTGHDSRIDLDSAIQRIVNGEQTDGFEAVGYVGPLGCSGTLISPTHVLTAAHCTEGVGNTQGTFEVNGQTYQTTRIYNHPDYNPNDFGRGDDLAIMELNRPVEGVTPMEIFRQVPEVGAMLTLVGFGEGGTSTGGFDPNDTGKQVGQTELEEVTDEHIAWNFDKHTESNTAPGDSGGPAFVQVNGQYLIAGVTSGGTGDPHQLGDYSFDTRIDVHAQWIDNIVGSSDPGDDDGGGDDGGDDGGGDDGGGDPSGDDHADTTNSDATRIAINQNGKGNATGTFEVEGDRDAFQFTLREDGQTTITLREDGSDVDTYLRIYNANGQIVAQNDDFGGTFDSQVVRNLKKGTYYAVAGTYDDSGVGDFKINISHIAADSGGNYTTFTNNRVKEISNVGRDRVWTGINVRGLEGKISDLNVTVDIDHSWVGDLRLILVAPDRTRVVLVNRQGDDGQNFDSTTFDRQASQHINRGEAPFSGTFRPAHNLNKLNGMDPNGRWYLVAMDFEDGEGGQINSWSMDIKTDASRQRDTSADFAVAQPSSTEQAEPQRQIQTQSTTCSVDHGLAGARSQSAAAIASLDSGETERNVRDDAASRRLALLDTVFSDGLLSGV